MMTRARKHLHRARRGRRGGGGGFTLIEILVAVGIIVLLMAIGLPMLSKARKAARATQATSNLVALETALNAYKTDFADFPRPDIENSGFAILGKALFSPGPDPTRSGFTGLPLPKDGEAHGSGTVTSQGTPGQTNYKEYVAFGMPDASGGFATKTLPPDPKNWVEFPVSDGVDGPGFRVRFGGQPKPAYLQEGKFRLRGVAILDTWDNPIVYFVARPTKPAPNPTNGEWSLLPLTPAAGNNALYNSFHNLSFFMRPGDDIANAQHQQAARKRMEAVLIVPGDTNANNFDGTMETQSPKNERAVTDKAVLLWSAGADGVFGPNFAGADPTPEEINKIDDVTNFKE
jgi:general secretion pathway protein G